MKRGLAHNTVLIGLLLAGLAAPAGRAQLNLAMDEAMGIYAGGNYRRAFHQFQALAKMGFADAQHNFGVMHVNGEFVERDPVEGYAWLALAAERGDEAHSSNFERLKESLSADQLKRAGQRAEELVSQYGHRALAARLLPDSRLSCQRGRPRRVAGSTSDRNRRPSLQALGGVVITQFLVYPDGSVRHPAVVYSEPDDLFDREALQELLFWKFESFGGDNPQFTIKPRVMTHVFEFLPQGPRRIYSQPGFIPGYQDFVTRVRSMASDQVPAALFLQGVGYRALEFDRLSPQLAAEAILQAALLNSPPAQYHVGDRLLSNGCTTDDLASGRLWLRISTMEGFAPAAFHLSQLGIVGDDRFRFEVEDDWILLLIASRVSYPPALFGLGWRLATAANINEHAVAMARTLLDAIPDRLRKDPQRYRIEAALAAVEGDFEEAIDEQEEAIDRAEDRDWDLTELRAELETLKQGRRIVDDQLTISPAMLNQLRAWAEEQQGP